MVLQRSGGHSATPFVVLDGRLSELLGLLDQNFELGRKEASVVVVTAKNSNLVQGKSGADSCLQNAGGDAQVV